MQVFLFVNLTEVPSFSYQQPVIQWLKKVAPSVIAIDLDTFSEDLLANQACRLLQEAKQFVVYIKAENAEVPFRATQKLIEELIWKDKSGTVLLEGNHRRLQQIIPARPHLTFHSEDTAEDLQPFLKAAFSITNK